MNHRQYGHVDKSAEEETIRIDKSVYNKRFKHVRGERRVVQEDGSIMLKAEERKKRDDERKKEAWEKVLIKHQSSIPKLEEELSQMERASFLSGQQKERRQYVKRLVHALKERQSSSSIVDGEIVGTKRPQRAPEDGDDSQLSMCHRDIDRGQLNTMLEDLDAIYKGYNHKRSLRSHTEEMSGLISSSPATIMAAFADVIEGESWASALALSSNSTPLQSIDIQQYQCKPNAVPPSKTVLSWEASTVSEHGVHDSSKMIPRSVLLKKKRKEEHNADAVSVPISRDVMPNMRCPEAMKGECLNGADCRHPLMTPLTGDDPIKDVIGDLEEEDIDALLEEL